MPLEPVERSAPADYVKREPARFSKIGNPRPLERAGCQRSIIPEKFRWKNWGVDNKDGKALTSDDLLLFVNAELFPCLKNLEIDETIPMSKVIVKTAFEDNHNYMKDGVLLRQVINIIDEIEFENSVCSILERTATDGKIYKDDSVGEVLLYKTPDSEVKVEVYLINEMLWLTQKAMANLFEVSVPTINEHLKNIFDSRELLQDSVIRKFRITAMDNKNYLTNHYNFDYPIIWL